MEPTALDTSELVGSKANSFPCHLIRYVNVTIVIGRVGDDDPTQMKNYPPRLRDQAESRVSQMIFFVKGYLFVFTFAAQRSRKCRAFRQHEILNNGSSMQLRNEPVPAEAATEHDIALWPRIHEVYSNIALGNLRGQPGQLRKPSIS